MKKIFTCLFLFGILTFTYSFASASYSEELQDAYDFAYEKGITTMDSIEKADMEGNLTRIAMAKMISQYAINILEKTPDLSQDCQFADVDTQLDESYNRGVTLSCQLGLMGKGGKFFNPHKTVTRAELGTVLSRLLYGLEDGNPYYQPHLKKLKEKEIIKNDDPTLKEQRGYFMLMLMRSQGKENKVMSSEQALQIMLKELNLEEERKNIKNSTIACTPFNDTSVNQIYACSFIYQGKGFSSWINASDGTFIPLRIIKDGSGGETDDKNGKNIIISNVIIGEEQKNIKKLFEKYEHLDTINRGIGTLGEYDTNTLIVYADDERELYMDREIKSKINSSENLLSLLEKDSGVPKDIIAEQSNYNYIHHQKWDYGENKEILFVYNFEYQGIQYEYKINPLNGKIIESNKREKTKFITLDDIEDQGYHFTDITKETSGGNLITFELADKITFYGEDIILGEYTVHEDITEQDLFGFAVGTYFYLNIEGRTAKGSISQNPGEFVDLNGVRIGQGNPILSGKYLALLNPYDIQEGVKITISALNRSKGDADDKGYDTVSFKVSEIPNPVKTEILITLEGDGYIFSDVTIKKDPYSTVNFQLEKPQDTGDFVYLGKVTLSKDANGVASNGFYVDKKLLGNTNIMNFKKGTYPIYISKEDLLKGKEYKLYFHGYEMGIDSDEVSFIITKLPPSGIIHRAVITDGMGERTFLGKADQYENYSDNILLYPSLKFISNNDDFDERVPEVLKKLQITSENKSFSRKVGEEPTYTNSGRYEYHYGYANRNVRSYQREEWIPLEIESNDEIDPLKITLHYDGKEIPIQYTKNKCLVGGCGGLRNEEEEFDIYDESSYSSDKTYTADNIMDEVNQLLNTAPVRGDKKGRFVIIEYTELLCPFCQRQSQQGVINQVIDKFPGEIASVSQHYLIHGTPALRLAAAMECVAETNPKVYYQVMEEAFATDDIDVTILEKIAGNHGVDVETMDSCYQEGKYISKVYDMSNMGSTLFGVSGTPSNVIIDKETGKYEIVAGAYPVDEFVNVINKMKNA